MSKIKHLVSYVTQFHGKMLVQLDCGHLAYVKDQLQCASGVQPYAATVMCETPECQRAQEDK